MPEIKFPKSLIICGIRYKIILHPKVLGGEFSWVKHLIRIEKGLSPHRRFNILIHEVCEIIMVEYFMRFQKCIEGELRNGDYLFSFDHDRFEIFTNELSGALKQICQR